MIFERQCKTIFPLLQCLLSAQTMVTFLRSSGEGPLKIRDLPVHVDHMPTLRSGGDMLAARDRSVYVNFVERDWLYSEDQTVTLNAATCRQIIKTVWTFLMMFAADRRTVLNTLSFDNTVDLNVVRYGVTEFSGKSATIRINIANHYSYLDYLNTVVHELHIRWKMQKLQMITRASFAQLCRHCCV